MIYVDGRDVALCAAQMDRHRWYAASRAALVLALMLFSCFAGLLPFALAADGQPILRVVAVRYPSDTKVPGGGVAPGGKFTIELSAAPEAEDRLLVDIDKERAYVVPIGASDNTGRGKEWSVTVPPVGWGKKALQVALSRREAEPQQLPGNQGEINVLPPAPVVNRIDQTIKLDQVFKVSGQGFLVPREAIHLSIGDKAYPASEVDPAGTWFT